jgi:hypothetical protein
VQELLELRQLREENGRLKRLVADLSLERRFLEKTSSINPASKLRVVTLGL